MTCKESKGEFHHDKFISGGKGLSIFFNDTWMTPGAFEKLAGSKAKKYKESLYVNGQRIIKLIDPNGTGQATPSCRPRLSLSKNKHSGQWSSNLIPTDLEKNVGVLGVVSQADQDPANSLPCERQSLICNVQLLNIFKSFSYHIQSINRTKGIKLHYHHKYHQPKYPKSAFLEIQWN